MRNDTYIFGSGDTTSGDGGSMSGYSLRPEFARQQPSMPFGIRESYSDNMDLMERLAKASSVDATRIWLHAVSEKLITAPPELAARYGLDGLPYWDYKATTPQRNEGRKGEDAGNFNYGASGYALLSSILREAGIERGALLDAGLFVGTWVLRFGGGDQQFLKDWKAIIKDPADWSKWKRVLFLDGRNWYREENRDADVIERGIEYGRYREFAKLARQYGVNLAPENFGFSEPKSPYHLLERNLAEEFDPDDAGGESDQKRKEVPPPPERRTEWDRDIWGELPRPGGGNVDPGEDDEDDGMDETGGEDGFGDDVPETE